LLRHLGVERAVVLGASLGGATALDFALEHPEMVDALVLVAPGLGGYGFSAATVAKFDEIEAAFERDGVAAANELELRMWVDGPARTPDQVNPAVRERVRQMNADVYAAAIGGAERRRPQPPAIERLAEIQAPILIVVGRGDVADFLAIADLLEARIAGARKVVLPDVAHMLTMEQPAAFNRIVLEFLGDELAS
jgi:pimeloyl-ACP methyl ester carboxylesterase